MIDSFLGKTKDLLVVRYYGSNDFCGRYFLKNVLENLDGIEQNKDEINNKVVNIATLYNHLWINSFHSLVQDIDAYGIKEEYKIRLTTLNNYFEFDKIGFIKFINKSFAEIFDKSNHDNLLWHDFYDATAKLCFEKFSSGLTDDFISFFETKFTLNILSDFKIFSSFYAKRMERLYSMFDGLKSTKTFDDQIYRRFLENYQNKKDEFFIQQAKFICERSLKKIVDLKLNSDSDEIIQIQSMFQEYQRLATAYSLVCSNQYNEYSKKLTKLLDEYIHKHGVEFKSGPIDLKPAIEMLKKEPSEYKFLQLTLNKENEDISNCLNYIFKETNKNNPLSEVMNDISRNRSDKYPYYKQDSMSTNLWVRSLLVNAVLNDETLLGQFANYLFNVTLILNKDYFNSLIDIEKETTGIVDSLANLINLAKIDQFETPYGKSVTVGTTYQICACIEKILRNVAYKESADNQYFDDTISLRDILKNYNLNDVSEGSKYFIEFYLIKEINLQKPQDQKPGLNLRNKLMHGDNDIYENTTYETCLRLFYLLLSLINDLFVKTPKS